MISSTELLPMSIAAAIRRGARRRPPGSRHRLAPRRLVPQVRALPPAHELGERALGHGELLVAASERPRERRGEAGVLGPRLGGPPSPPGGGGGGGAGRPPAQGGGRMPPRGSTRPTGRIGPKASVSRPRRAISSIGMQPSK